MALLKQKIGEVNKMGPSLYFDNFALSVLLPLNSSVGEGIP